MTIPVFPLFSPTEISALQLEGEFFAGQPIDIVDDWRSRCEFVLQHERWPMVLTGVSALWAYGYCSEPRKHCASILPPRRVRLPNNAAVHVEERSLSPHEYVLSGFHGVTTPQRTLLDSLKLPEEIWCGELHTALRRMTDEHSAIVESVTERFLHDPKQPHRTVALSRMEQLFQPS